MLPAIIAVLVLPLAPMGFLTGWCSHEHLTQLLVHRTMVWLLLASRSPSNDHRIA
ncbi:MAG: hypothetical protein ACOCXA_03555 [Planctomycetota bacterium]